MLRQIRLYNSKKVSNVVFSGGRKVVEDLLGSFLLLEPGIYYSMALLLEDPPYPQLLEPQLLVAHAHLMDLYNEEGLQQF